MDAETIFKEIRRLTRSNYYQSIYNLDNKNLNIYIFHNSLDLSPLQIMFLNYLGFYSSLNLDVHLGEVDERVFENEIYEDAYFYYKNKRRKTDKDKRKTTSQDKPTGITSQWIFKSPQKVNKYGNRT